MSRVTFWSADERDVVTPGIAAVELSLRTLVVVGTCLMGPASGFVIVVVTIEAVPSGKEGVGGGDVRAVGVLFPDSDCDVDRGSLTRV